MESMGWGAAGLSQGWVGHRVGETEDFFLKRRGQTDFTETTLRNRHDSKHSTQFDPKRVRKRDRLRIDQGTPHTRSDEQRARVEATLPHRRTARLALESRGGSQLLCAEEIWIIGLDDNHDIAWTSIERKLDHG
jgi:hypothetical protein